MTSNEALLVHGTVFTSDPEQPWAQAVVARGGVIEFVGSLAEARALAGDSEAIDAGEGLVLPGFVDAHAHLLGTGASLRRAQLRSAGTLGEVADTLQQWLAANPYAPRVLGIGWLFTAIPDGLPTRQML
ncbi:MAG TPA: amidohydrolase family protein, partial [Ilumatobacteraceae bacterium]|nr:amidohydrolase family protein [Ilumatobacteraceae bacterium]